MFDIGITEIGVIAVVALIVIGPERLPRVARMIGTMLGRAQRYVNDVKAEVNREIELEELKKLQTEMQDAARGIQQQVTTAGAEVQSAVSDMEKQLQSGVTAAVATPATSDVALGAPATERVPLPGEAAYFSTPPPAPEPQSVPPPPPLSPEWYEPLQEPPGAAQADAEPMPSHVASSSIHPAPSHAASSSIHPAPSHASSSIHPAPSAAGPAGGTARAAHQPSPAGPHAELREPTHTPDNGTSADIRRANADAAATSDAARPAVVEKPAQSSLFS